MKRGTRLVLAGILLVVETAVAAGVFFGAAYGLTRLAENRQNAPVGALGDGTIVLLPEKALTRGGLKFFPTEWEQRAEGYGNEYGRALAKERKNRKIGNWSAISDAAEWDFIVESAGGYRVEVELAAPAEEAGSEIVATLGTQAVSGIVPDTGGWNTWKTIALGSVILEADRHVLALKAKSISYEKAMNVAKVVLRPVE